MIVEKGWWGIVNEVIHMERIKFDGPRLESASSSGTPGAVGDGEGGRRSRDCGT